MRSDRTSRTWVRRLGNLCKLLCGCVVGAVLLALWAGLPDARAQQTREQELASQARGILAAHCAQCHGNLRKTKDLNVLDHKSLLERPGRKPAVVPGKPDASLL